MIISLPLIDSQFRRTVVIPKNKYLIRVVNLQIKSSPSLYDSNAIISMPPCDLIFDDSNFGDANEGALLDIIVSGKLQGITNVANLDATTEITLVINLVDICGNDEYVIDKWSYIVLDMAAIN